MKNTLLKLTIISVIVCSSVQFTKANEALWLDRIFEGATKVIKRKNDCSENLVNTCNFIGSRDVIKNLQDNQIQQIISSQSLDEKRNRYNCLSADDKRDVFVGVSEVFYDNSDKFPVYVDTLTYLVNNGCPVDNSYKLMIQKLQAKKNANAGIIGMEILMMKTTYLNKLPKQDLEKIKRDLEVIERDKNLTIDKVRSILQKKT